jgi:hypothetical protein
MGTLWARMSTRTVRAACVNWLLPLLCLAATIIAAGPVGGALAPTGRGPVSYYVGVFVFGIALGLCNGVIVARLLGARLFRASHAGARAFFVVPPQEPPAARESGGTSSSSSLPSSSLSSGSGAGSTGGNKISRWIKRLLRSLGGCLEPAQERARSIRGTSGFPIRRRLPVIVTGVLKLMQNLSFAFLPAIRWNETDSGTKWVPDVARVAILEFATFGLAPRFWFAVALSLITVAVGSVVTLALAISSVRDNRPRAERLAYPTRNAVDEGDFWPWVARVFPFISADFLRKIPLGSVALPLLAGFVYNIALRIYVTVLDCVEVNPDGVDGGSVFVLELDPTMICWTGPHHRYVAAAMVLLTMHSLTSAVLFVAFLREFKPDDDVRMTGAYEILSRAAEAVAIVLAVLLTRQPGIPLGFTFCTEIALWVWVTFRLHNPCPGFPWMNGLVSATHGLAAWAHVCALVSVEVIKTGEGAVPTAMFVAGTLVVALVAVIVAAREQRLARY